MVANTQTALVLPYLDSRLTRTAPSLVCVLSQVESGSRLTCDPAANTEQAMSDPEGQPLAEVPDLMSLDPKTEMQQPPNLKRKDAGPRSGEGKKRQHQSEPASGSGPVIGLGSEQVRDMVATEPSDDKSAQLLPALDLAANSSTTIFPALLLSQQQMTTRQSPMTPNGAVGSVDFPLPAQATSPVATRVSNQTPPVNEVRMV